jgi:hypothetical protein
MNSMILYHGSDQVVEFPEIRRARYTKDFSWGFYCTNDPDQAARWAARGNGRGVVNRYRFTEDSSLSVLRFAEMTDQWLDFIAQCRSGAVHHYDIVEGPMADDTIWNYVNDYLAGNISREAFWVLAKFKHPTHQISFHTLAALSCLTYEGSDIIHD